MNFSSLALFAAICLAADNSSKLACKSVPVMSQSALNVHTNTSGLQTLIMNQHPEQIIPYLMSCKNFSEELAMAFAIGLDLGKHTEILSKLRGYSQKNTRYVIIITDELRKILLDKINWMSDPFEKLFDSTCLHKALNLNKGSLEFPEFQSVFAKCAVNAEAMIAVNVAILKWFVFEVHSKPDEVLHVAPSLLQSVSALSMNPLISKFLMDDTQIVIEQAKLWTDADYYFSSTYEVYFSSLLTLLKFLDDDNPIRSDIETIAAIMYVNGEKTCVESRLTLGANHPFVLSMEKDASKEKLALCDTQMQTQIKCRRKLHSLGYGWNLFFDRDKMFLGKNKLPHLLWAIVKEDDLEWEMNDPLLADINYFENSDQSRLFILSMLRPPSTFCESVTSCTSLKDFQKLLQRSAIRRMILTYGITILESSFLYNV